MRVRSWPLPGPAPPRTAAATAAKWRSVTARLRGLPRRSASSAPAANSRASAALTSPVPAHGHAGGVGLQA